MYSHNPIHSRQTPDSAPASASIPQTSTIPPYDTISRDALREIGRGILESIDTGTRIYQESPDEATLGALLRFVTRAYDADSTRLEVRAREPLVLPTVPAVVVEPDLLIRCAATGAAALVEVEGWEWHRRNAAEHDEEIRRDRQLRRYYPTVIRYAAREVQRDPWGTLLDVYQHLRATPGFAGAEMTSGMRALAEACAAAAAPAEVSAPQVEEGRPLSLLDHVRNVVATLPPPPPTSDPALQRVRRDYPRMYAPWEDAETEVLQHAFRAHLDIEQIALAMGRTQPALWAQLRRMGIVDG